MANAFETLVAWIRVTDLEQAELLEVRQLVSTALAVLEDDDARLEDLQRCEDLLWQGAVPVEELGALAERWGDVDPSATVPDGVRLEEEFRKLAASLTPREWATAAYDEAVQAVEAFEDGDDEALERWTQSMTAKLEVAWKSYSDVTLTPDEITAETVVGHRLLLEGFQGWYDAQEMLILASQEGGEFDPGLERAEQANRLLVAVQKLSARINQTAA